MHKFSRLAATAMAVAALGTTMAAQGHGAGKAPTTKAPSVGTSTPKGGGPSAHGASSTKSGDTGHGATAKTSGSAHGASKKPATTTTSTSTSTSSGSGTTGTTGTGTTTTPTTFEPNAISTKISKNPSQLAKVNTMLPKGMTIEEASAGFRNQGQFVAALNTSKNQHIDFVQLKDAMTVDGLSLGQAAKQVRDGSGTGTCDDGDRLYDDGDRLDDDVGNDNRSGGEVTGGIVRYRFLPSAIALFVLVGLALPGLAKAQGNGRPKAPRGSSPTTTTPTSPPASSSETTPATPLLVPVSGYRQFGAWLDDASASTKGEGYTSVAVGHWRMLGSSQTNLPMLGVGMGVTDRMQVSASVPFYRASYEGGSASGMDDVYLGAKYTLIDPTLTLSEFGLAISPTMEVLSASNPDGRIHFAVPVSMELRRQPFRVYGSAGIFTRGSLFSGAALEWSSPGGMVVTGSLTQSYSLKDDAVLDSLGIGRQRMDVSLGVAYPLGTTAATFVNVGRSLTSMEEGGTSLALSGGISIRFSTVANP